MTVYYSTKKVVGPDVSVKTDLSIRAPSPAQLRTGLFPEQRPILRIRSIHNERPQPTVAINIIYKIEATLYAKFWGKKALVQ